MMGRAFTSEEDRSGSDNVVELSYSLWQNQYHGDPNILGRTIKLDEKPYTVIGVMPPSFHFPFDGKPFSEMADLWLPIGFSPDVLAPQNRVMEFGVGLIGRLKPGVTARAGAAGCRSTSPTSSSKRHPDSYSGNVRVTPRVYAFAAHTVEKARPLLLLLSRCGHLRVADRVRQCRQSAAGPGERAHAARWPFAVPSAQLARPCCGSVWWKVLCSLCLVVVRGSRWPCARLPGLRNYGPASVPRLHEITVHPLALLFTLGLSVHYDDSVWLHAGVAAVARRAAGVPQGLGADRHLAQQPASAKCGCHRRDRAGAGAADRRQLAGSQLPARVEHSARLRSQGAFVVRTIFDTQRYPDPVKRMAVQKEMLSRASRTCPE